MGKSESRREPAGITCHRAGRIAVIEVPGSFDIYVNPKIRELAVTPQTGVKGQPPVIDL